MADPPVIDVEFEETPMPERPREARSVSLPKAVATLGDRIAAQCDAVGLHGAAATARTVADKATAADRVVDAVRDFGATAKAQGWVGSSKRPPLRRRAP